MGSDILKEPRLVGEILEEMLANHEFLFRKVFPTTELGIDLKMITRRGERLDVGEMLRGRLTYLGDYTFTFIEDDTLFEDEKSESLVEENTAASNH